MKFYFLLMMVLSCSNMIFAQKPPISSEVYSKWPFLGSVNLSNDGKYIKYDLNNYPVGRNTLVIQSTENKWKKEIIGDLSRTYFANNGKLLIFQSGKDSIGIMALGTERISYIPHTSNFQLQTYSGEELLCYQTTINSKKNLVIKNLSTDEELVYPDVSSWQFSEAGKILILWKNLSNNREHQSMHIVDVVKGEISKIWEGKKPENVILDNNNKQLAFQSNDSLYFYKEYTGRSAPIKSRKISDLMDSLELLTIDRFSKDGARLFISLIKKQQPNRKKSVEVWSYRDKRLQSESGNNLQSAVLDLNKEKIRILQSDDDSYLSFPDSKNASDTVALAAKNTGEEIWNYCNEKAWTLIYTKSGLRRPLTIKSTSKNVNISSLGKYVIYMDSAKQNYFSYEIANGKQRNLTSSLNVKWTGIQRDDLPEAKVPRSSPLWLENDKAFLIYDQFDIWKVDPLNEVSPINLTNSYGKRHNIVFNIISCSIGNGQVNNQRMVLNAFDVENKKNGYYLSQLNRKEDPKYLSMGSFLDCTYSTYVPDGSDFYPIKAKYTDRYIVRRMSANNAPNYFGTKDFKTFIKLSNLQPEKDYNWYTTELHTWKSLDGRTLKGILYKPENFDPKKKYPIIFHYYERKSDGLNAYIKPGPIDGGCNINIPTFVSNGYLIFCPDIYYKVGDPMQGVYDSVISAADYISGLAFVDRNKMGIQGCSFGGIETNYLITRSKLFTAAVSSSGAANLVSVYGSLAGDGGQSQQNYFENGQIRMGSTLWGNPGAYISNSPIFHLDKIVTPLLIMHTKNDDRFSFTDAIEFFTGLRRLGKKAWLLGYPVGNHSVRGEEAEDFGARMMQYFNHYLKDKPAPIWMTRSKYIDLDGTKDCRIGDFMEKTPGHGLLTIEEQLKVDSLMNRKPIKIQIK